MTFEMHLESIYHSFDAFHPLHHLDLGIYVEIATHELGDFLKKEGTFKNLCDDLTDEVWRQR